MGVFFESGDNQFDVTFENFVQVSGGDYDSGYKAGYSQGEAKGRDEGYKDGKAEGLTEGYQSGYAQGDADGQAKGKVEGESIGYADALAKRTDLVVTENGEYTPPSESTGFKSVSVNVETVGGAGGGSGDIDALIDRSITEVSSGVASIGNNVFDECKLLTSADFPNATTIGSYAFRGCYALTSADFPNATKIGSYALNGCRALTSVDFPKMTSIATYALQNCYCLKAVILRTGTLCTIPNKNAFNGCYHILGTVDTNYNPNGDKDGYFYVPRALVDSYKSATNWSTYSTQFRALEDYTVDGTTTGELDPNKI